MSERWFKCGACGTEARGFLTGKEINRFAYEHALGCPGPLLARAEARLQELYAVVLHATCPPQQRGE